MRRPGLWNARDPGEDRKKVGGEGEHLVTKRQLDI